MGIIIPKPLNMHPIFHLKVLKLLKLNFPLMSSVLLTNDANAAAIGEIINDKAKKMNNLMYTLGTGVGSGMVKT